MIAKLFTKGIIGILLLGVLGVFIFRIYQQRDVLSEIHQWIISGKYIFEGIDPERMRENLKLMDLNYSIPSLDKIYNASFSVGSSGLEKVDLDKCRSYYQLVLEDMPQIQEAHVFLGFCEYKAGDVSGAFFDFKQGLGAGAGVFWSSYNLGVLAMMNGNNNIAEVLFLQVAKFPLQEEMKNIYASKLFQQYIQSNNIAPQKIWDGLNEARDDAIQNLKLIEEGRASSVIPIKHEMRLRIF